MPSWPDFMKNFDKRLECEEIDDFLDHLNTSVNRRIKKIEEEEKNLSPDKFENPIDMDYYRDHLNEFIISLNATKSLGDELSIIALYKKVETQTVRVLKMKLPNMTSKRLSIYTQFCEALPFDVKTVDGFLSFNELRLINNSIKHEGKVSSDLAKEFPTWNEGAELPDLDLSFQRLLPGVKHYVADLVERLYARGITS